MNWFSSFTDAIVTIVIGVLAFVGLGSKVTPVQNPEPQPTVVQVATSASTTEIKFEPKIVEVQPTTKNPAVKPSVAPPQPKSEPKTVEPEPIIPESAPAYTILFQPPKSRCTQEELTRLNEEAIKYFKANMNCEGLAAYALTYCQAFENLPEVQMIKAVLQHNAEVEARNSGPGTSSN